MLQFADISYQPQPCSVQKINFSIFEFYPAGRENRTKEVLLCGLVERNAAAEFIKSRHNKNFRISPVIPIFKIKVSEAFFQIFGFEFCPYPCGFNYRISESVGKTYRGMVVRSNNMGCSQQFMGRPGMPVEIPYTVKYGSPCRMNFYILLPVKEKFNPSVVISRENIHMCTFRKRFKKAGNLVFFLPGNLRDIMLYIPKEHYPVRRNCLYVSQNPVQPVFHAAGQINSASVKVPFDPQVDIGNNQGSFRVRGCKCRFFKNWGDFRRHG